MRLWKEPSAESAFLHRRSVRHALSSSETKTRSGSLVALCRRGALYEDATSVWSSDTEEVLEKWWHGVYERPLRSLCFIVHRQIPRRSPEAIKTVVDQIAETNSQVANLGPEQFIDSRFFQELEKEGFIQRLWNKSLAQDGVRKLTPSLIDSILNPRAS